jgi:putative transposase
MYLYRAVDKARKTVDFFLSRKRDVNAAKTFLRKAITGQRIPTNITLDAYAHPTAQSRIAKEMVSCRNNTIELKHRRMK